MLTSAGFTDLLAQFQAADAYSYVFDGQLGYLDYALDGGDVLDEVAEAAVWNVNADEPSLVDYEAAALPSFILMPNNKDRAVRMHIDAEDESGDVTVALTDVTVTGSTKAAWEQTGDRTFHGQGGERRSTFTCTATDAAGNTATDTAVVVVGVKGLLGLF